MSGATDILSHVALGIDYLTQLQSNDGSWRDYRLPVGESDQWVTAFTGVGMARAARALGSDKAAGAAERALQYLINAQKYQAGWGYNGETGIDADSTAYAIQLFRELGCPVAAENEACLRSHFRDDGGVCTYRQNSGWGVSHPDVTASAALALDDNELAGMKPSLAAYCRQSFIADIGWPTYWWKNHIYSTWLMLELHQRLGVAAPPLGSLMSVAIDSVFDLAWGVGVLKQLDYPDAVLARPLALLCAMQEPCGKWPGAANLRVTDPDCYTPWIVPQGDYYVDHSGTISTAAALTVLSRIITSGLTCRKS